MVTKHVLYSCDICGGKFHAREAAEQCEAKGIPAKSKLPIGLMYGDHRVGAFYERITFCIAPGGRVEGHYWHGLAYACRDNQNGDSLGKDKGGKCEARIHGEQHLCTKAPHFRRMVEFLKSQGIQPTILKGAEVVPWNEEEDSNEES